MLGFSEAIPLSTYFADGDRQRRANTEEREMRREQLQEGNDEQLTDEALARCEYFERLRK